MLKDMLDDWPALEGKTIHFYHCDHLGTPTALINKDGEVDWSVELDAWGNVLKEHNPKNIDQPIRFQGQHFDEESGLHYNRHRYYDPQLGRYINQDPIGFDGRGLNFYQYTSNSPLNITDPKGLILPLLAVIAGGTLVIYWSAGTYASMESGNILRESAFRELQEANKVQEVVLDCEINPSSHLGCSDKELLNELSRSVQPMREEAIKNLQKAACLLGTGTPGTSLSGPVSTNLPELGGDTAKNLILPDACQ